MQPVNPGEVAGGRPVPVPGQECFAPERLELLDGTGYGGRIGQFR